jgi:predicted acyltransferase
MPEPNQRFLTIDVFRGMTLMLMMVVNMSVSDTQSYAPLLHAVWHGFTLTDQVFPSFLFAVGMSMCITLPRLQSQGTATLVRKVLQRTALIFLCGYLLYWFPFVGFDKSGSLHMLPLANTRILGVLQRIALCYGLAALLLHFVQTRFVLLLALAVLLLNWWVLAHFGDYSLSGNAALKLDLRLLGDTHMYRGEGIAYDPEGLLGTLPAVVNVLAGFFTARYLLAQPLTAARLRRLVGAGLALVYLALVWDQALPINKKLWTSSYVLCTIGLDLCAVALLSYVLEVRQKTGWTGFFEILGRNTLFIYLLSEILQSIGWIAHVGDKALFTWLYETFFTGWISDKNGSLLYAVLFMLGCWLAGYVLDRKKIYIKL